MIKKITLIAFSSLMMIGCSAVDNAIKKNINGNTTEADIKKKAKVIIITDIDSISCAIVSTAIKNDYPNGLPFLSDSASCDTFNKSSTDCKMQSLTQLKADYPNEANLQTITGGDKSCVVGSDKPTPN